MTIFLSCPTIAPPFRGKCIIYTLDSQGVYRCGGGRYLGTSHGEGSANQIATVAGGNLWQGKVFGAVSVDGLSVWIRESRLSFGLSPALRSIAPSGLFRPVRWGPPGEPHPQPDKKAPSGASSRRELKNMACFSL